MPHMSPTRVSPATERETTVGERMKRWLARSVDKAQSPLFQFRNMGAAQIEITQNLRHEQLFFDGGYWVGYHRDWFLALAQRGFWRAGFVAGARMVAKF